MRKSLTIAAAAAGIATGAALAAATVRLLIGLNRNIDTAEISTRRIGPPTDGLVAAATDLLTSSDKIEADSIMVARTGPGQIDVYGQVSSSAAAGALLRRLRKLEDGLTVNSHFRVAKRS